MKQLEISLPPGASALANWREASSGSLIAMRGVEVNASAGSVVLKGIDLDDEQPLRMLVADVTWS